jgi:hypothetical protein
MWRSSLKMKTFHFWDDENSEEKSVIIKELLDPSYGCYIWPSAFVLAEYIWHERDSFKDKTILEVSLTKDSQVYCSFMKDIHYITIIIARIGNLITRIFMCITL